MAPRQLICRWCGGLVALFYPTPRSPTRLQPPNLRAGPALRGQFNRTFVVRTLRWTRFSLPQIQFRNRE